jgi:hypothetical protein
MWLITALFLWVATYKASIFNICTTLAVVFSLFQAAPVIIVQEQTTESSSLQQAPLLTTQQRSTIQSGSLQ